MCHDICIFGNFSIHYLLLFLFLLHLGEMISPEEGRRRLAKNMGTWVLEGINGEPPMLGLYSTKVINKG